MDDHHDNPILSRSEGRGRTLPSTYSTPRDEPRKPKPTAAIGRIIAELGLRYRPTAQADLIAHAEAIRLLTEDVGDIPPHLLEKAAKRWVRENKWMPKASELIDLARDETLPPQAVSVQAWCDARNAGMPRFSQPKPDEQIEWYPDWTIGEPTPKLRWKTAWKAPHPSEYCTPAEARKILRDHPSTFARAMLAAIETRD